MVSFWLPFKINIQNGGACPILRNLQMKPISNTQLFGLQTTHVRLAYETPFFRSTQFYSWFLTPLLLPLFFTLCISCPSLAKDTLIGICKSGAVKAQHLEASWHSFASLLRWFPPKKTAWLFFWAAGLRLVQSNQKDPFSRPDY